MGEFEKVVASHQDGRLQRPVPSHRPPPAPQPQALCPWLVSFAQRIGHLTDAMQTAMRDPAPEQIPSREEPHMAKFMDVHGGFVGVTEQQLTEAHERDLAIEPDEGVHFERTWLDPESGKVFCLSTGPSKESVQRVHERAGHPTEEIYEVPIEVS
jgi:Protein of unknown function (DUF4242)